MIMYLIFNCQVRFLLFPVFVPSVVSLYLTFADRFRFRFESILPNLFKY